MKRLLIVGGIVAAMVAPMSAAYASSAQVGTPDCYVQVDYLNPNLVIGGDRPPYFTMNPEGSVGAGAHCPI